jgi:hypothetical protein
MTLAKFIAESGLADLGELQKVYHFAFYHLKKGTVQEFSAADGAKWVRDQGMGNPNTSRLGDRLKSSRDCVTGTKPGLYRLHHKFLTTLETKFPQLSEKSQEIADDGTILPPALYDKTRGYIESLAKQINRSYEENIFDGCAVLMRRLEEVLLIMAYEHLGIAAAIKDANDNYVMLEAIVKNGAGNGKLNLSRNGKKSIEVFRELGNYSAHKITYTCKREYIKEKIDEYRALIDELLHKAGLRT